MAEVQSSFEGTYLSMPRKRSTDSSPAVPKAVTAATPVKEKAPSKKASAVTHKHKKPVAEPPEPISATPARIPMYEEIARLAYSYWEARGKQGGSQEEDWLRAEAELRSRPS